MFFQGFGLFDDFLTHCSLIIISSHRFAFLVSWVQNPFFLYELSSIFFVVVLEIVDFQPEQFLPVPVLEDYVHLVFGCPAP
jgi:hypothetical protein